MTNDKWGTWVSARKRVRSGFTLVELMVVVVILSVLAVAIAPQFAGTYQAALLRGVARQLVTAVRLASSQAVTRGRDVRLMIDGERHRYWMECRQGESGSAVPPLPIRSLPEPTPILHVPGASGELHEKILVEVVKSSRERPDAASPGTAPRPGGREGRKSTSWGTGIPFHSDGTTEAHEIILRDSEGFGLALRIHPTTSRVRTVALEPGLPSAGTGRERRAP